MSLGWATIQMWAKTLPITSTSRMTPWKWLDTKKEPLLMATIMKLELLDRIRMLGVEEALDPPSGKPNKATKVTPLDGLLCQAANHNCQGVYMCDKLDSSLLDHHERYEPNEDNIRELFEADRPVNVGKTSSVELRAVAFYVHRKKCPHTDGNGVQCEDRLPVYRKLKQVSEQCPVKSLTIWLHWMPVLSAE
ncbi:hypothetical protein C8R45DRAFT_928615 [Mycena sanguinolenta]|nr:hypothetical protein C8R45DRAFT_928615 [Mycena sanguinolenta]